MSRQLVTAVKGLLIELADTSAHFVRCIKPNERSAPAELDDAYVMRQLRYSGTVAALRLLQSSFPTRIAYNEVYSRYHRLVAGKVEGVADLAPADFAESLTLAVGVDPSRYALGRSMIFFKLGAAQALHELAELPPDVLTDKLAGSLASFAAKTRARRAIATGVHHWVRWRRARQRRLERERREKVTEMLERVVLVRRAKRRWRCAEARNLARAEARARAAGGGDGAVAAGGGCGVGASRRAHGALAAAEAAAAHADLPEGWADAPDCAPQLRAARAQLAALEEEEALAAADEERAIAADAADAVGGRRGRRRRGRRRAR